MSQVKPITSTQISVSEKNAVLLLEERAKQARERDSNLEKEKEMLPLELSPLQQQNTLKESALGQGSLQKPVLSTRGQNFLQHKGRQAAELLKGYGPDQRLKPSSDKGQMLQKANAESLPKPPAAAVDIEAGLLAISKTKTADSQEQQVSEAKLPAAQISGKEIEEKRKMATHLQWQQQVSALSQMKESVEKRTEANSQLQRKLPSSLAEAAMTNKAAEKTEASLKYQFSQWGFQHNVSIQLGSVMVEGTAVFHPSDALVQQRLRESFDQQQGQGRQQWQMADEQEQHQPRQDRRRQYDRD